MANGTEETTSSSSVSCKSASAVQSSEAKHSDMAANGTKSADPASSGHSGQTTKQVRYSFQKQPFVIGVAGGTASGKSSVCSKIMGRLGPLDPTSKYLSHEKRVICISQDSFYRALTEPERALVAKGNFNFDHPSAFDVNRLVSTLRDLQNGKMIKLQQYDYLKNEMGEEKVFYPADVVLVEGLLLFYFPEVREMFQMKIFVDTDPDTRLARRVARDVKDLNRNLDLVLSQYINFVKPSFEEFCLPTKKYADIIVPRGPDNEVAVDLIVTHVQSIFDPSIRHQSIKYYDNNSVRTPATERARTTSSSSSKKKTTPAAAKTEPPCTLNGSLDLAAFGFANDAQPLTVAGLMNEPCASPVLLNGDSAPQLKHSEQKLFNGGAHSPMLRNGFISSSAPSHLSGFGGANGLEHQLNGLRMGHLKAGAISSEDEDEETEEEDEYVNGGLKEQSSQSPSPVPVTSLVHAPVVVVSKVAPGKVAPANSQPKVPQPAPILLVAGR